MPNAKYKLTCEKQERNELPEFFSPTHGIGTKIVHDGKNYIAHPCNKEELREVKIIIMTYKGVAANAAHYYVIIDYIPLFLKDPNNMRHIMPVFYDKLPKETWGWNMKVMRQINAAELKTTRFSFFNGVEEQFRYTDALNSWEEIVEALELFLPKFKGCITKFDVYSNVLKSILVEKFIEDRKIK